MKLTKKLAVALHRRLWHWIADETEKQQRVVEKQEYPLFKRRLILNRCWCCEYARSDCEKCPIIWHIKKDKCQCELAQYAEWADAVDAKDWREAARLARIIADLPERKED